MMRIYLLALLTVAILISSCSTYKSRVPREPTHTGQTFTLSNAKGEKIFDVTAPTGQWISYNRTKEKVNKFLQFYYKGPNSGMINAEIRIMYIDSTWSGETIEEAKNSTTITYLNKSMAKLLDKDNRNNLQDFYKPKKLVHGIKNIAGIHCRYFSIVNHSGPTLDAPTVEFRGMGSARKEEDYFCPVMRDGKSWFLNVEIVYQYSDVIRQKGLNIDFFQTIKDFDAMLKPTIESLKLYGDLKQY